MKFRADRTFLLSIRGRRLPLLWFLTFFAPYLCCFLFAAPHFHNGECGMANHGDKQTTLQWQQLHHSSWVADASQCLECAWLLGAQGQVTQQLPSISLQTSSFDYFIAVASPTATRDFATNNRGPPLS